MFLYVEDLEKGKLSSLPFLHSCAVTVAKRDSAAPDVALALLGAALRPFPSEPPRPCLLSGAAGWGDITELHLARTARGVRACSLLPIA